MRVRVDVIGVPLQSGIARFYAEWDRFLLARLFTEVQDGHSLVITGAPSANLATEEPPFDNRRPIIDIKV